MNTKTTLVLAVVAVAVASYVLFIDKPWEAQQAKVEPKTVAVALYEPKPEDPDRVEVQRRDGKKLVFVKDAQTKAWNMVEPMESPAPEYQVKQIVDRVGEIKFDRKYGPNDKDRPSEKVSGLDKPTAVVRLLKGDKELAHVTVGSRLPTGKGNYLKVNKDVKVKVNDEEQVVSAQDVLESSADLGDTFMAKIDTYRDKNVVKFDLNDVKRMTIEGDRNYVLVKNNDQWVLESPIRSRADKSKAESVVRALTSLYVAEFKDDEPSSYTPYGLEPARMKVTVETEKTIPAKAKPGDPNTQPADIEPTKQQVTHELLVGGPVDASGKQYFARLGGKPWVFSINEHTYKQLATEVPDLQDKAIASVDTAKVKSIKADTPDGSLTLTRQDEGNWVDGENQTADQIAVQDLLKAVNELKAVNFVDPKTELIAVNWDQPRARLTVVQEGSLNPVTILVGPASASGKMVFVRNAAEEAVAAVREDAVAQLLAGPVSYRDRTVMRFDRERANRIEISQPGKDAVTLVQKNNNWSMVEPAAAQVDREAVRNLMQDISNLQAKRIVGAGDRARFGLDAAPVTVAAYVEPVTADPNVKVVGEAATQPAASTKPAAATQPASTRPAKSIPERIAQIEQLIEYQKTNPKENPLATKMLHEELAKLKAQTQPAAAVAEGAGTTQPADVAAQTADEPAPAGPTVLKLHLAQKDGKTYGAVDGKDMIYEIDTQVFTDATAEMHDQQVTRFESSQVTEVQFAEGQDSLVFRKSGDDWKYALDPVLPIDKEKVTKALDELKDVKTHRYVSYKADDLAAYGLDAPARTFSYALDGGQRTELLISAKGPENDPDKSVYATIAGQGKVFLLKPDQVTKFTRSLDDFEKTAGGSENSTVSGAGPLPAYGSPQ